MKLLASTTHYRLAGLALYASFLSVYHCHG